MASAAFGQSTEVRFVASESTPVFQVTSLIAERSGLSLTTEMTEVYRKLELLTIPPSQVTLANGDYWLSWGGTEEFSRTFLLRATGTPVEVRLSGNRTLALWSTYGVALGTLGTLVTLAATSAPAGQGTFPAATSIVTGAVALAGAVGLVVFNPRVEIIAP